MSVRESRRLAREAAMQALFQLDLNPDMTLEAIDQFIATRLVTPGLQDFARNLVQGVQANRAAIDEWLAAAAQNWSLARMAPVDRNVLRLAVYELKFTPDTPPKVAINEAIEICKRFSTGDSPSFVNGLLNQIAGLASS